MDQSLPDIKFYTNPQWPQLVLRFSSYRQETFALHTHDTFSLGLILQGQTRFYHNEQRLLASQGDLVTFNPGEPHACNPLPHTTLSYAMFYLEAEWFQNLMAIKGDSPFLFSKSIWCSPGVYRSLLEISQAMVLQAPVLQIETQLCEILGGLTHNEMVFQPSMPVPEKLSLVRDYLLDNLSVNVSLNELAKVSGTSPYHLLREFRRLYHLPPHAFQLQHRIQRARRLLAEGKPPAQVAVDLGFVDQSHLTRKFKNFVGTTPRQFQESFQRSNPIFPVNELTKLVGP